MCVIGNEEAQNW